MQHTIFVYSSFPGLDACHHIYVQILKQHMAIPTNKYPIMVQRFAETLVATALACHTKAASSFLPTAVKFHYIFNLRDLSNIFQVGHYNCHVYIVQKRLILQKWLSYAEQCPQNYQLYRTVQYSTQLEVTQAYEKYANQNVYMALQCFYVAISCHFLIIFDHNFTILRKVTIIRYNFVQKRNCVMFEFS